MSGLARSLFSTLKCLVGKTSDKGLVYPLDQNGEQEHQRARAAVIMSLYIPNSLDLALIHYIYKKQKEQGYIYQISHRTIHTVQLQAIHFKL